ncbi:MAG: ABC transporter ATP-binding protein [Gammaproteobacteria bacterium]|nr:ABC transporter ATP-binding protein [Gammaproteobacteria bacterium]
MKNAILELNDLSISVQSKKLETRLVNQLCFDLKEGETLAIVGESGSGKSLSSLALMGLLPKTLTLSSGTLQLMGKSLNLNSELEMQKIRGNDVAMIFQEPMTALTPVLSIGEQLMEGILHHQKIGYSAAKTLAVDMLRKARISDPEKRMKQFPHELSGGMRQRVMIAMALACRPKILIADEPTTALDVTVQAQILALMKSLQQQFGTSIILVTHDMGVVAEMADRVLVMCQGESVETGLVSDVLINPRHPYTQKLLKCLPVLGKTNDTQTVNPITPSKSPLLDVQNLVVRFDIANGLFRRVKSRVHAVENVDLSIQVGETLALVGESGSGKSTLGRAILNLTSIESGSVIFDGREIAGLPANQMRSLRRDIQMIFQDPMASLNPRHKVKALVSEPMKIFYKLSNAQRMTKTIELLERVGLKESDMHRYPHEFSGGQRQRICIARAISTEPKIIVADECVSALDVSVQAQILDLLKELQEEKNISFLFISHDLAVVERVSHRIAVMTQGQIVESGNTDAVLQNAQHAYTRQLISAVPNPDPTQNRLSNNTVTNSEPLSPIRPLNYRPPRHHKSVIDGDHHHWIIESEEHRTSRSISIDALSN